MASRVTQPFLSEIQQTESEVELVVALESVLQRHEASVLQRCADWFQTASHNADLSKRYTPQYLAGFKAAAGWVKSWATMGRTPATEHIQPNVTPVADTIPFRGSDMEQWIKNTRDMYPRTAPGWEALDAFLDDYRERADTGTEMLVPGAEALAAEAQVVQVKRVIDALRGAEGSIHGPVVDEVRRSTGEWLQAALEGRLDPDDVKKGYATNRPIATP